MELRKLIALEIGRNAFVIDAKTQLLKPIDVPGLLDRIQYHDLMAQGARTHCDRIQQVAGDSSALELRVNGQSNHVHVSFMAVKLNRGNDLPFPFGHEPDTLPSAVSLTRCHFAGRSVNRSQGRKRSFANGSDSVCIIGRCFANGELGENRHNVPLLLLTNPASRTRDRAPEPSGSAARR